MYVDLDSSIPVIILKQTHVHVAFCPPHNNLHYQLPKHWSFLLHHPVRNCKHILINANKHSLTVKYRVIRNDCRGFNNLPPRSPDANPRDFFLWGYVKDQVYVPPLPASIPELKVRIRTATETITADMLQTVWNELDYRVDVCRITNGAHIEHL